MRLAWHRLMRRLGLWRFPTCQKAHTPCKYPYCFDWTFTDDQRKAIEDLRRRQAPPCLPPKGERDDLAG